MAWTQSDVDALKAAIGTGVTAVSYSDGSRVEYRSLTEMRSTLRMMIAEVSPTCNVRSVRVSPRSGFR